MPARGAIELGSIGLIGAALAALVLASCAPSSDAQQQMQSNESALREMVANDRQQIEALQQQLAQQNDRIAQVEHNDSSTDDDQTAAKPANPPAPPTAGQPAPGASPDQSLADAQPPASGASDENSTSAATPAVAPSPPAVAMAVPPPAVAPPAPAAPPPAAPTWQASAASELATSQKDAGAKLYRGGLTDLRAGKYQPGLAKLQDLQRRYRKSNLSEPAEYFSGNALFELAQYEKSILQFNDLTMRFPEGRFASASLLREAQAFTKINDLIDARLTLQKLLSDHPSAPEAPLAKSMMESLSS
jgi:TolA-binding protein